jgi:nucleotide-binding universal stress UspA family protein
MLELLARPRRPAHHPFARILCAVDADEAPEAAIEQAVALAGGDRHLVFVSFRRDRDALGRAVARARRSGVQAASEELDASRPAEALLRATGWHDLVVVGADAHALVTGVTLGETATTVVHRSPIPVLVARRRPLAAGVVAATGALPADRAAVSAAARITARLGAELTVVHVPGSADWERRNELKAEIGRARALLGRPLDYVEPEGAVAPAIVAVAHEAGLVVVGSTGERGVRAVDSISARVAHSAPCSVLIVRER